MKNKLMNLALFSLLTVISNFSYGQNAIVTVEDYKRAEKFLWQNFSKQVFKNQVNPKWIEETNNFWYKNNLKDGKEFILVQPESNVRKTAFDHKRFAIELSKTLDSTFFKNKLPFNSISFDKPLENFEFTYNKVKWKCELDSYKITKLDSASKSPASDVLVSPDGEWELFTKDFNLWVRRMDSKKEEQLTFDGKEYYDYASMPESSTTEVTMRLAGLEFPLAALWSPNSNKIITHRLDQRKVKDLSLIQSVFNDGSLRPKLHTYKMPYPTDEFVPMSELVIIDLFKKKVYNVNSSPLVNHAFTPFFYQNIWWDKDGENIYIVDIDRGYLSISLNKVNARTGNVEKLIQEKDSIPFQTNINIFNRPNVRILKNGEQFIWFSQRTGWGHIYLYETNSGKLIKQITSGEWNVEDIIRVDEDEGWIYFTGIGKEKGQDPYYTNLYRSTLDGNKIELLTPENADHTIKLSPSGKYFIDSYSRVNLPTVSVLRNINGKLLCELEKADISVLLSEGWQFPEPFKVKAADDSTDIYGVIYFPTHFDKQKKYPVIEDLYPGPQMINTSKKFIENSRSAQALSELGFIVIILDGRGTPFRSKKMLDYSYGNIGEASSLEDHVYALKQLASERPYMDLNKVGCYGHSAGGYGSVRAILSYPDFYKVSVSSAGVHDIRGYLSVFGDRFQGLYNESKYKNQDNLSLAKQLKGKLLLVFGDMDDNVHPAGTLQLIDALIKANKNYDLIVLPYNNHYFSRSMAYFTRRKFDYFVKHLKGCEPPENIELKL